MSAFIPCLPSSAPLSLSARAPSALPRRPSRQLLTRRPSRPAHLSPACTAGAPTPGSAAAQSSSDAPDADSPPTGHDCRVEIAGRQVAYDYFPGTGPTVVFLPGFFYSRWRQAKANSLEICAKRKGQAILVEEYVGIGRSEGDFIKEGTLTRWISDTIELIQQVVGDGKVVLVGAGIGGWIMLHVAMKLSRQVVGLVGVNPSVDFTEDLLWPSLSDEQKMEIETEGSVNLPWGFRSYPIGKPLLEDAKKWLVLHGEKGSLDITCPVRLLQGMNDEEVPADRILQLVDMLQSEDVVTQFIKYGDHVLEDDDDMSRMWDAVCDVSEKYFEYDLTSPSSG